VVERALRVHSPVLVVDDGSTDGGPEGLAGLPVECVRLGENRGKGAALLAGAKSAAARGATHMISLDADGQHHPEDIPLFLARIEQDPNALIIGRRDFSVPHVPAPARFGRAFSGFWMRAQTGIAVQDMQSGFRAYPLELFDCVRLTETRYSFEVEVVVRAAWAGFALCEIPIRVYYPPRGERISHFRLFRDNLRISLLNTRLTIRALLPLPFTCYAGASRDRLSPLRPLASLRHLLAHNATPADLARSTGLSVFVSTLPLPGLQSILLLLCVGWFRLHRAAAVSVAPLTWPPFVPGLCVLVGYRLRQGEWLTEFSIRTLGHEAWQRVFDWAAGALCMAPLLGLLTACIVGSAALGLARTLRKRREA
jgi:uncharacterized protein (DUF2062 family)